ncbi:acetyl-CoA decarbonylase/synthase complex subunit gamma [Candidatus Lokiarchaeum ossiferum]|uniref:acetyl-CoA decarbonylase/synthase complex subunit gamma n=1 Tax=Candidatus Lokiarchaeum ossiferum TaxID=2951803 RepID=UPI00352F4E23
MKNRATPLQIFKFLDKTNCKLCGKESCLEFATDVLERNIALKKCEHLQFPEQQMNYHQIRKLLLPPQKEVIFGTGTRKCKIGGEEVLYRHQRTFYNPTAIAVEISDNISDWKEFEKKIQYLTDLSIIRIGEKLTLDALAIRYTSQIPENYIKVVELVFKISNLPVILCCLDPSIVEGILEHFHNHRPLIYAANSQNADAFAKISRKYDVPLACFAPDLSSLVNLISSLEKFGVTDIVIDPGIFFTSGGKFFTLNRIQEIRYNIFENHHSLMGYPLMGVPAVLWSQNQTNISSVEELSAGFNLTPEIQKIFEDQSQASTSLWKKQYEEVLMGILLQTIDSNLIISHVGQNAEEIWGLMALMTYRQNIFTDPRVYPRVDPGLTIINSPSEWSPVYVTSNYRMTKIPVEQDLIDANLDGYLVVVDTEGIGIESATAGGQFNEEQIKKTLDKHNIFNKIRHRIIIIPGMAARLKAPLEDLAKCEVWVGPRDSSSIPSFIQEKWKIDEIKAKYSQT